MWTMARYVDLPVGDAGTAGRGGAAATAWIRTRAMPWLPLAGVVLLSLALNTWALSVAGYGNTYYAAAVRSMTMSWKNFFFGAFDPGGFITVDKPPVFLWVPVSSATRSGRSCSRALSQGRPASHCCG
jgi:4-amino-4-deoxy-L-arabinose transferase-like glycosyltransferase